MTARKRSLRHGKRKFACGCVQEKPDDVKFIPPGYKPVCTQHGQPVIGAIITCAKCGKEDLRPPQSGTAKYCRSCSAPKKKGLRRRPKITARQKAFILEHPSMTYMQVAEALKIPKERARVYQRQCGISGKHPARLEEASFDEWFSGAVKRVERRLYARH